MSLDVDEILRGTDRPAAGSEKPPWLKLGIVVALGGFIEGAVMGFHGERWVQALCSGVKVPMLLIAATLLCLPSFYVINSLLGLRQDFGAACQGIFAAQASLAICLAALSPLLVLAHVSGSGYLFAVILSGFIFLLAALGGQAALARSYRDLIARDPRHRWSWTAWLTLYLFVSIQMAWVLRPFLGKESLPPRIFREDAWSNAYVEVLRIITTWMTGK